MPSQPMLSFGLVTDIQHADKDTVVFDNRPQRYRESAGKLCHAMAHLQQINQQQQPLAFLLTCGDIIDGYPDTDCQAEEKTTKDLLYVANVTDEALQPMPTHHVLGNHCLAAKREQLLQVLHLPSSYYSVQIAQGWKLVVLDTTDMSLHSGFAQDSEQIQQAQAWLAAHPTAQYPNAEPWNGGLTKQQLAWLESELTAAADRQQQVIVACHHPLAPGSAPHQYMAWDNDVIMEMLERHEGLVRLVISGHYHPGGYAHRNNVHYVVFEGILEAPADSNAYGVVEVWADRISIKGFGVARSRDLSFV